jgi:hypothetical protein
VDEEVTEYPGEIVKEELWRNIRGNELSDYPHKIATKIIDALTAAGYTIETDWDALQHQIVASIRADLLLGAYTPGFTIGDYFVNGVKDSVAIGIAAYLEKETSDD